MVVMSPSCEPSSSTSPSSSAQPTPSLESWSNAQKGRYILIEMRQRVANRPLPAVELVDMRVEFQQTGQEQIFLPPPDRRDTVRPQSQ